MFLARFLRERFKEICEGKMKPMTRAQRKRGLEYSSWQRLHADEDGKITFVSIFTILAMIMFIGLVLNVIVSVHQKIEMQNAADTAAYTANLWRARGMNAITTVNHLMGEQTALLTILDGFGGDLLGDPEIRVDESERANQRLRVVFGEGSLLSPPATRMSEFGKVLNKFDAEVVKKCYERMTEDKGRHKAAAAIYDAKMQLKVSTQKIFEIKNGVNAVMVLAGILEEIPYPPVTAVGYLLDGGCAALHVDLSYELIELTKERVIIDLAEDLLGKIDRKSIDKSMREVVFPALTMYADSVVGSMKGKASPSLSPRVLRRRWPR